MKLLLNLFLIIITLIEYIESCMRLTGCSWGNDPCTKYKDMYSCFNNADCMWGNLEEPPESPVNVEIEFGGKPGYDIGLRPQGGQNNGGPNVQQIINGVETCKGRNFKPCYINCSIF